MHTSLPVTADHLRPDTSSTSSPRTPPPVAMLVVPLFQKWGQIMDKEGDWGVHMPSSGLHVR